VDLLAFKKAPSLLNYLLGNDAKNFGGHTIKYCADLIDLREKFNKYAALQAAVSDQIAGPVAAVRGGSPWIKGKGLMYSLLIICKGLPRPLRNEVALPAWACNVL
jgi:hypothetical protein